LGDDLAISPPETERITHYRFADVGWNIGAKTASEEMREKVSDLRRFAFSDQDMPMIAEQADISEKAGPDYKRPVWLDIDVGVAHWRKAVADLLAQEADAPEMEKIA
jgi:vanillate O-demethylase monooxygenase subunit